MQMIIRMPYTRVKKAIRKSKRKERKKGRKISKTRDVK